MNWKLSIIMAIGLILIQPEIMEAAETPLPQMRISVENTASHFQTRAVARFAQQLKTALYGRIDVQFFSGARFSHSICRECADKFYPDLDIYEDDED